MTTAIPLTNTQRQVLEHAAEQPDGRLGWFPDHIHGGARKKVIEGLWKKALITDVGPDWFIAPEGYDALGRVPVALPTTHTPTPRWKPPWWPPRRNGWRRRPRRICSRSPPTTNPAAARTVNRPP